VKYLAPSPPLPLILPLAWLLLVAAPAAADQLPEPPPIPAEPSEPGESREPGESSEPGEPGESSARDAHVQALEDRLAALEDELAQAKDDQSFLEDKLAALLPISGKIGGYLDLGFFATTGNGAGTRSDFAGVYFPEYVGIVPGSWVFMGDPLSTTINSRGDVADTGESRAIVFDPIRSRGNSTFLVNALNLTLFSGIGETAQLNASVDFLPRARDISDLGGLFLGDYLDVKLAYAEWRPRTERFELALQAGKFDSVLGREYRVLESPDRTGVTPSLICRYTCGRPVGLKARAQFLDQALVLNVAVTNGSHFHEGFTFANETDRNQMKTGAGRLSYQIADRVELGVSGAFGAQDFQPEDDVYQWHVGGDLLVTWKDLEVTAELVRGWAKGQTSMGGVRCDLAPCLKYWGGYVHAAYRVTNVLVPYLRVDSRDAMHWSGASFVYISTTARATVGIRAELGTRVILKAEGTLNREIDLDDETRIPVIPNDVFTSSLVVKY
jgi:hypothetical protein